MPSHWVEAASAPGPWSRQPAARSAPVAGVSFRRRPRGISSRSEVRARGFSGVVRRLHVRVNLGRWFGCAQPAAWPQAASGFAIWLRPLVLVPAVAARRPQADHHSHENKVLSSEARACQSRRNPSCGFRRRELVNLEIVVRGAPQTFVTRIEYIQQLCVFCPLSAPRSKIPGGAEPKKRKGPEGLDPITTSLLTQGIYGPSCFAALRLGPARFCWGNFERRTTEVVDRNGGERGIRTPGGGLSPLTLSRRVR